MEIFHAVSLDTDESPMYPSDAPKYGLKLTLLFTQEAEANVVSPQKRVTISPEVQTIPTDKVGSVVYASEDVT